MSTKTKNIVFTILGIILLVIVTAGTSYAIFTYTKLGTTDNTVTSGTLKFLYTENSGTGRGISIENAFPVSDEVGKSYATDDLVFDFKIEGTNTGIEEIPYEITLRKKNDSTLREDAVKVYLTEKDQDKETSIVSPTIYSNLSQTKINVKDNIEKTLYYGSVSGNTENYVKEFRLRMWLKEGLDFTGGEYNNKIFTTTVNVYADTNVVIEKNVYKETILNGTDPILSGNLVPIKIASDGTVTQANINNQWYSYENKEWANAVILKDETKTYQNGETIPESNIESYFVWIPRYKYKIFDDGSYTELTSIESKEQVIEVVFENKETTPSNGQTVGSYLTHPAFTSFNSNGMWVGKFETGYDGATTTTEAEVNSVATDKIIIKPNVYSWRNMTVGNMFKNSYDYMRDLDSHMMKNTEWGAVAYLQHSSYGSATSIRVNNNSAYITGYAATEEPTLGYSTTSIEGNRFESTSIGVDGIYTVNYLNPSSNVSSTTGNYTGIYDMSGGTPEYVMGYSTTADSDRQLSEIENNYTNFFNSDLYSKYWDSYNSTSFTNYTNRILGDATGEMGPFEKKDQNVNRYSTSWYSDYSYFVWSRNPWAARGGFFYWGYGAGIFASDVYPGSASGGIGYRIVLVPQ